MAEIYVTRANGNAFVDFAVAEVLDISVSNRIGTQMQEVVDRGDVTNLVVDFRRIKLMTSSMIGELIKLRSLCEEAKVQLYFCNLSNELAGLLKKLKLDKSFKIYATREHVVKAIASKK